MLLAFVFSIAMTNTYLILDVVVDAAFAKDGRDGSFSGDETVCAARSDRLQPASPNSDATAIPPAKFECFRRIMLSLLGKTGFSVFNRGRLSRSLRMRAQAGHACDPDPKRIRNRC